MLVFLTECSASTGNQPLDYSFPGFSPTRPYEAREREGRKENLGTSLNRQCGLIDLGKTKMLRLYKTFNSFNVIGDQWTPYTYTKKRKKEWSQSRIFLFDLRSMPSFIGWSTESAVARGGGSRGQKRLDCEQSLIFLLNHGDREHVTLRVKGEERWRKPKWRK